MHLQFDMMWVYGLVTTVLVTCVAAKKDLIVSDDTCDSEIDMEVEKEVTLHYIGSHLTSKACKFIFTSSSWDSKINIDGLEVNVCNVKVTYNEGVYSAFPDKEFKCYDKQQDTWNTVRSKAFVSFERDLSVVYPGTGAVSLRVTLTSIGDESPDAIDVAGDIVTSIAVTIAIVLAVLVVVIIVIVIIICCVCNRRRRTAGTVYRPPQQAAATTGLHPAQATTPAYPQQAGYPPQPQGYQPPPQGYPTGYQQPPPQGYGSAYQPPQEKPLQASAPPAGDYQMKSMGPPP